MASDTLWLFLFSIDVYCRHSRAYQIYNELITIVIQREPLCVDIPGILSYSEHLNPTLCALACSYPNMSPTFSLSPSAPKQEPVSTQHPHHYP
jgi:hypothetical protein